MTNSAPPEADQPPEILFETSDAGLALVTLNRPRQLNALTLRMIREFSPRLAEWHRDPQIRLVAIKGAGERAFCAGGDVRAVSTAGQKGAALSRDFFREEYALNRAIFRYAKPYVSLINGISMGGGVGLSAHGAFRVVTENLTFAMPETGIGLFPDVGGSYFLSRCPGETGMYLALTGARLKAADARYVGYATHIVRATELGALEAALRIQAPATPQVLEDLLRGLAGEAGQPALAEHRACIDRCFSAESVEAVIAALESEGSEFARTALATLQSKSPTSLKITFEQIRRGRKLDFEACLAMEYRMVQACMRGHDFHEGIRALLIDKDQTPVWSPAHLEQVTPAAVAAYFEPPPEGDLTFGAGGRA
jgi:enoyl-CoA hydratase